MLSWMLTMVSCTSDNPLLGEWNVVSYSNPSDMSSKEVTDADCTLQLHDNGFFSFTTDCNTISGEFTISEKQIQFFNLSATEIACEKELMEQNIKLLLPMIKSYGLSNDSTLSLIGNHGTVLITLIPRAN